MEKINNTDQAPVESVRWEASEYIHHEKDSMWFIIFIAATAVVLAIIYVILRDPLSLIVIGLMAVALAIFANRKPRVLQYEVNDQGVIIGERKFSYDSFRSFSLLEDGAIESILLNPLQKLMPPLTVYYDPNDKEQIIQLISDFLPFNEHEPDIIDRFARRIRF